MTRLRRRIITTAQTGRELFEAHGAAIYRFVVVLARHHQDAEDVVQETFLKLLRHLEAGGHGERARLAVHGGGARRPRPAAGTCPVGSFCSCHGRRLRHSNHKDTKDHQDTTITRDFVGFGALVIFVKSPWPVFRG